MLIVGNRAVGVVAELLHRDRTGVTATTGQRPVVVEEVRATLEVDHTRVIGEAGALPRHDRSPVRPRPGRPGRGGVRDELRATLRRENVVVQPVALEHPRPLLIQGRPTRIAVTGAEPRRRERDARRAAGVRDHVRVQLHVPQARVTPVQVRLPVIVDEDARIDLVVADQWSTERVAERPGRAVRHPDADDHLPVGALAHRHVPVELPVARDDLPGPRVGVRPGERRQAHRRAVIGPVHHVRGRVHPPLTHGEVGGPVLVMPGVEVDPAVVHHRRRVGGVDVLDDGVVGLGRARDQCEDAGHARQPGDRAPGPAVGPGCGSIFHLHDFSHRECAVRVV